MGYEQRIILFIDILGFTNEIKKSSKDIEKFNKIQSTLEYIQSLFNIGNNYSVTEIVQFSDSLIISIDAKFPGGVLHMISNASFSMHAFFTNGFICKGAITIGDIYHKKDILFGPGFLEVMKIEALEDKPIIKFNKELLDLARLYPTPAQIGYEDTEIKYILEHAESIENSNCYEIAWHKDYAGLVGGGNSHTDEHYENIKELIERNIKNFNNIRVLQKYLYLKNKFNNSEYLKLKFPNGIETTFSCFKIIYFFIPYIKNSFVAYLTKLYWKNK